MQDQQRAPWLLYYEGARHGNRQKTKEGHPRLTGFRNHTKQHTVHVRNHQQLIAILYLDEFKKPTLVEFLEFPMDGVFVYLWLLVTSLPAHHHVCSFNTFSFQTMWVGKASAGASSGSCHPRATLNAEPV